MNTTPENFERLPLDVQLSAYLDNELPELLARQLSRRLKTDRNLQRALERLETGSVVGNRLFEALLNEPVPLSFARAIRRGEGVAAKLATY